MLTDPELVEKVEDVDHFRRRARAWLADNMPLLADSRRDPSEDRRAHDRRLQRALWDGGFAGICFPAAYGGLGLTVAHQHAVSKEALPYGMPFLLNLATLLILAANLGGFRDQA